MVLETADNRIQEKSCLKRDTFHYKVTIKTGRGNKDPEGAELFYWLFSELLRLIGS